MRLFIIIIVICIISVAVVCYVIPRQAQTQYEQAMCDCQKLKLGMTIDEVEAPIKRTSGIIVDQETYAWEKIETWAFDIPKGMSDRVECFVDSKSGAIVGYICADSGSAFHTIAFVERYGYDSLNNIFVSLSSIRSGISKDCVAGILGAPSEKQINSSGSVWIYPKAWLGYQEPRILFDSSGVVVSVDIDRDRFVVR